jgi:3-phenylpropionate/trans-cinnamate dioxygenase ferredoxin reductase subunit
MALGTVIVGGSVAGVGTANELRRLGYRDPITIVDAQPHLPYDRPPLSKALLTGQADLAAITFHSAEHYDDRDITIRSGVPAVGLDPALRRVELADGSHLAGAAVVLATGARARPFPVGEHSGPVWTIRELADVLGLRERLQGASRVAVIGGGFIGAEVASSARYLGLEVVVIEAARQPFERLLGPEVATLLAGLHADAGTELRCGVPVQRVEQCPGGQRIHLTDGSHIDADVVVAGLGALPEVAWLASSGLLLDGAVACDSGGRTTAAGIYAAGDVATWHNPAVGSAHRHEHWTSAREQARIVAHEIAGPPSTGEVGPQWQDNVPYVWSDQYGKRIQVLGYPDTADTVKLIEQNAERGSFIALYGRAGRLVAVVGCNAAAKTMRYRPKLAGGGVEFEQA